MENQNIASTPSSSSPSSLLESYLTDLKKVIEWLVGSENLLNDQSHIGNDVNTVKLQFQTHEVLLGLY